MPAIGKGVTLEGIIGNKSWRQDDGPNADFVHLWLFLEVHRPGRTEFLTRLAPPTFLKIDAVLGINDVLEGNGLRIRNVCSLSLA
jgi:hypothetical protein